MKKLSYSMLAVAVSVISISVAQTDLSCDLVNDSCPSRLDGVCDSELGSNPKPDCQGGDCADCDQCMQYVDDCGGCVANGCYWCPSDTTCFNSPNNNHLNIFSECRTPDDFEQSCPSLANSSDLEPKFNSNFFQDPLYDWQAWVFDMIHVLPVWQQGIFGSSIRVRVNDNGVDASHDEFGARFDEFASCDSFLPHPNDPSNYHGTAVASILGAQANNDECGVGIAPNVTISACNIFDSPNDAFLAEQVQAFDISQNSFGYPACGTGRRRDLLVQHDNQCPFTFIRPGLTDPCSVCDFQDDSFTPPKRTSTSSCQTAIVRHCRYNYEEDVPGCLQFLDLFLPGGRCDYNVLTPPARDALAKGILEGRDGKGIIYVFASGNSFAFGDDTNFKGYTNTRLTISVGSVGKNGMHASYSTPGASLVVTAPGGDHENASNHITANVGGGCRDPGVGTSFACPVVSGVVALVLEANPELTWRDVQGILATTSRMVLNDPYDTSRVVNAAGLSHSNLYGFGVVDASAAVEAAKTWELYSTEKRIMGESGIFDWALVPDDSSSFVMSTIQLVPDTDDFLVESVEVYIDLQHFSRGDLEIVLTSPHGAESVLHPGNRPENTLLEEGDSWKLLTVRAWGESAKGDWTMVIRDISPGDALKCADAPWTVSFVADGLVLDCDYIASFELCVDGALNPTADTGQLYLLLSFEDHGRDIAEACCLCGGGLSTNAFEDQLRQWRIVVYGREIENPTSVPTKTPTNANISIASSIEAPVLALPSPAPSPSSSSLAPPTIPVTTIPRTQVRGGSSSSGSPGRIIQFHFGLLLAPSIILVLIY